MMKNRMGLAVALVAALALFNLATFLLPFAHTITFWVAYGFTTLAIVAAFTGSALLAGKDGDGGFLNAPAVMLLWMYCIAQVILGLKLMSGGLLAPVRLALLGCGGLLLVACLAVTAALGGGRRAGDMDRRRQAQRRDLQSLLLDVEALEGRTNDAPLRQRLRALAEAVRYSDPMTVEGLAPLEAQLRGGVVELGEALARGDTAEAGRMCSGLADLLAERNRRCRMMK